MQEQSEHEPPEQQHTTATLKSFLSETAKKLSLIPVQSNAIHQIQQQKAVQRLFKTLLQTIQQTLTEKTKALTEALKTDQTELKSLTESLETRCTERGELVARRASLFEESAHLLQKLTTPDQTSPNTPLISGFSFLPFAHVRVRTAPRAGRLVTRGRYIECVTALRSVDKAVREFERCDRGIFERMRVLKKRVASCLIDVRRFLRTSAEWNFVDINVEAVCEALLDDVVQEEVLCQFCGIVAVRWVRVFEAVENVSNDDLVVHGVEDVVGEIERIVRELYEVV